jgi:hypothetical protein
MSPSPAGRSASGLRAPEGPLGPRARPRPRSPGAFPSRTPTTPSCPSTGAGGWSTRPGPSCAGAAPAGRQADAGQRGQARLRGEVARPPRGQEQGRAPHGAEAHPRPRLGRAERRGPRLPRRLQGGRPGPRDPRGDLRQRRLGGRRGRCRAHLRDREGTVEGLRVHLDHPRQPLHADDLHAPLRRRRGGGGPRGGRGRRRGAARGGLPAVPPGVSNPGAAGPPATSLRRLKSAFDPLGIVAPGRYES